LDQGWVWIYIFEKNWIRTGSGYLFDFYNEISLRVIQDVTNDGVPVFFAIILAEGPYATPTNLHKLKLSIVAACVAPERGPRFFRHMARKENQTASFS